MKRWLPHPLLSGFLLVVWLLLQPRLTPGAILLGMLLALTLTRLLVRLQPPSLRPARPGLLMRLLYRVFVDMLRSNFAVARIVLFRGQDYTPGFVTIPLELTHPGSLAMLACIITATPGTLWISHDSGRCRLLIHVLDLVDQQSWIDHIKQRYERPLLEIFP